MYSMHKTHNHRGSELVDEDKMTQKKKPLHILRKGPYRGDISALCLISSPPYHLLLAGSGPHVLLYDLIAGNLLCSRYVFDGVRVYGMDSRPTFGKRGKQSSPNVSMRISSTIVIHGERRVKVFSMLWHSEEKAPELHLQGKLPRFSYWVMDVRLLMGEKATAKPLYVAGADTGIGDAQLLAVGLSNNTISIWDLFNSAFICHVDCSEVCLLYSMRLWGDSLEDFRVAAGTVFDEVLVWNLGSNLPAVRRKSTCLTEVGEHGDSRFPEAVRQQTIVQNDTTEAGAGTGAQSPQFEAVKASVYPLQRLSGHEGSIYRLMWASDGLSLMSASDDRSARVWFANRKAQNEDIDPWVAGVRSGPVLRGHGSRLWDCFIGEKLLISASEDCTCRVWTADGEYLATLKGHTGRGIWRCVYNQNYNYLVTGGADSSIKVHSLDNISPRTFQVGSDLEGQSGKQPSHCSNPQVFSVSPLWSKAGGEESSAFMDSKSEYLRCLLLSNPWSLYVCTNRGVVYHVDLSSSTHTPWTSIIDDLEGPIVCMDLLTQNGDGLGYPKDDVIVVGTGNGKVTSMRVRGNAEELHCESRCSWVGESERQLLGVHICKSVGWEYVFTTEPRGRWRLWHVSDQRLRPGNSTARMRSASSHGGMDDRFSTEDDVADLIAYGTGSPARVLCIDMCPNLQLLVCGDKQGNITAFSVPMHLLQWRPDLKRFVSITDSKAPVQLPVVAYFKGAHGISAVATVSLRPLKHDQWAEIISTGGDSCICTFILERRFDMKAAITQGSQHLQCSRIKKVAALSVVEGFPLVYRNGVTLALQKEERKIVGGFSGSDFLLWNVIDHSQVLRITCGGWRRPHSVIIGDLPELQHCFVYVKDQVIQVQRNWAMSQAGSYGSPLQHEASLSGATTVALTPTRSLRAQFHGKEISSVRLLFASRLLVRESLSPCDWIATGSEDGTVVISRFTECPEIGEQLEPTSLLVDHVGGSAIRALAVITRVHLINDTVGQPRGAGGEADPTDGKEPVQIRNGSQRSGEQELLFSAGAKEVLTCWLLHWFHAEVEDVEEALRHLNRDEEILSPPLQNEKKPVLPRRTFSAQWLSTQIPRKGRPSLKAVAHDEEISKPIERMDAQSLAEEQEISNGQSWDQRGSTSTGNISADDDHRYLGLTAFATRCVKTGTLVSFVATASSNATLHIHSFSVTHRFWNELAVLEYPSTLVLTVEHLVAPLPSHGGRSGNSYIILTGGANGNIALWDATSVVVSEYVSVAACDANKTRTQISSLRPLTGRGSQGGRFRKRTGKEPSAQVYGNDEISALLQVDAADILVARGLAPSPDQTEISEENFRNSTENSPGVNVFKKAPQPRSPSVLKPLREFTAAHQSGVNCLSVARVRKNEQMASDEIEYVMISGGDDQALHVAMFTLKLDNCYDELRNSAEDLGVANAHGKRREGISPQTSLVLNCFTENSVLLAHSSAVKGVWTDGVWAFSTGLDQRLRCWKLCLEDISDSELQRDCSPGENDETRDRKLGSPLQEYSTCVIDVPEATSLHVKHCVAGRYQIVVVGRGLQVINFDATSFTSC